jgi:hypothetical protein
MNMAEKRSGPFVFRPTQTNKKRLDYAAELDINCSEIVNECLEKHLQEFLARAIKAKAQQLQKALSAPVP